MASSVSTLDWRGEIANLQDIAQYFLPLSGDLPTLEGIDVYGTSIPVNGIVGGDHIIYVDFKSRYDLEARIRRALKSDRRDIVENLNRCRSRAGIALADVSGHQLTDVSLAMAFHQAFLLGVLYELDTHGEITTRLFELLNTRFYQSSSMSKFATLIYGEIAEGGKFRFISAGHPLPAVFSQRHDRMMNISGDMLITFPPIGTIPSAIDIDRRTHTSVLGYKEKYQVNEITLMGVGDILILFSDGMSELAADIEGFFPERLEAVFRDNGRGSAKQIVAALQDRLFEFAAPQDDLSFVVIKRTG